MHHGDYRSRGIPITREHEFGLGTINLQTHFESLVFNPQDHTLHDVCDSRGQDGNIVRKVKVSNI